MLWAATAYFNPQRYARRLANYRHFRARLEVPLLAVELGFNGCFELEHNDAEILVQIDDGAVLWQKERLLNVGLSHLPDDCEAVLSIDCDVFFLSRHWLPGVLKLLERYPVVQPYAVVQHLDRDWVPERPVRECVIFEQSAVAAVDDPEAALANATRRSAETIAPGHAWVYRRELLCGLGFFDSCIVGGGDTAMASAGWGCRTQSWHSIKCHRDRRHTTGIGRGRISIPCRGRSACWMVRSPIFGMEPSPIGNHATVTSFWRIMISSRGRTFALIHRVPGRGIRTNLYCTIKYVNTS